MTTKSMTLGSLFDGSGGFPLGGMLAGVRPVWASEIEPFAVAVTTKRFPEMKHYGDVSRLSGSDLEPVDIITFGSPCQDMSIAGKRAGLDGSRSNLFYEAVRIVKEMREATNGEKPRFIVWENVPGAFSSNGGRDFKAVLEAVIGVKEPGVEVPAPENNRWPEADVYLGTGWSVAYRVFDAQYWGVAQRRKRIYLVADFGGERAGDVLFKSEGMSGYTPQGFRTWEGTAGGTAAGVGAAGGVGDGGTDPGGGRLVLTDQGGSRMDISKDVTGTLRAQDHGHPPVVVDGADRKAAGFCTEHSAQSRSIGYEEEKSPTLRAGVVPAAIALENHPIDGRIKVEESNTVQTLTERMGTGGMNVPLVMEQPKAYGVCSKQSHSMLSDNPRAGFYEATVSRTLDQSGGNAITSNQGGIAVVAFAQNQRNEVRDLGEKAGALSAEPGSKQQTYVMQDQGFDRYSGTVTGSIAHTLNTSAGDCVPMVFALQGSMIGRENKNGPQGSGINEDVCFTLDGADRHAVAYEDDGTDNHATYCATTGSFMTCNKERSMPLMARDYKDPQIINDTEQPEEKLMPEPEYIVRRLTPTECAALQGFPRWWCAGLAIPNPTDEQIAFWTDVFETYRLAMAPSKKPKTENQIRKWLAAPHKDSAEYRLWGNGISLPIVHFVMCGIVWAAGLDNTEEENS